jgi:hypothetical protein
VNRGFLFGLRTLNGKATPAERINSGKTECQPSYTRCDGRKHIAEVVGTQ